MDRFVFSRLSLGSAVVAALVVLGCVADSEAADPNQRLTLPRSALDAPFDDRIHLVGFGGLGFGNYVETGRPGAGAAFILRPGTSRRFLEMLADWNASLVLQAEYQRADEDRRIYSADLIIRRYAHPFGEEPGRSFFYGAGFGACNATRTRGSNYSGIDALLEAGQEWHRDGRISVLFWQFQFRFYRYHDDDYSHCSIKAGAGVPLPW